MVFFQHRYYKLNKNLLEVLGLWPYQSLYIRVPITTVVFLFAASMLAPQLLAVVRNLDNRDLILESAGPLIFLGLCLIKVFTTMFNSHKMLKLLNRMRTDWEVWGRDVDVEVLHEYAEKGNQMTKLYAVLLMANWIIVNTQPVVLKIIDVLSKNGTEPGQFLIPLDYYFVDMQKYYFYIVVHCYVSTFVGFLSGIACDSILVVYVQHCCGLFAILRRKLERIGTNHISTESGHIKYGMDKPVMATEYLAWCIDKHNRAIDYAELIDATYSRCFFLIVAFNMILISIEGVQIVEVDNEPDLMIKLIYCIIMALVHLYLESYMGQILIDHSSSIRNYILNGKWYKLPVKDQKLLPLMVMRCNVPCKLTFAKMSVMSVETYGVILKTSLSYFTVLRTV